MRVPGSDVGSRCQEVREFKTTVRGLLALADWLKQHGVTVVAMEATGVYGGRCGLSWRASLS